MSLTKTPGKKDVVRFGLAGIMQTSPKVAIVSRRPLVPTARLVRETDNSRSSDIVLFYCPAHGEKHHRPSPFPKTPQVTAWTGVSERTKGPTLAQLRTRAKLEQAVSNSSLTSEIVFPPYSSSLSMTLERGACVAKTTSMHHHRTERTFRFPQSATRCPTCMYLEPPL